MPQSAGKNDIFKRNEISHLELLDNPQPHSPQTNLNIYEGFQSSEGKHI